MHAPDRLPHVLTLGVGLTALWLLASGHYKPLLLALGLGSVLLVVGISVRMDIADREGQPLHLNPFRLVCYWVWLLWALIKANIAVCRIILHARLPIQPAIVRSKSSQTSMLSRVLYANSITLTPGTVTIDVAGDEVVVHALTQEAAQELREGEMDRLATGVERKGAAECS